MEYNKRAMKRFSSTTMLIAGLLAAAPVAYAQFIPQPASLSASPHSPAPGETVTITATTPVLETAETFYRWRVNGVARPDLSGYGKNSFTATAGDVGTLIRVDVDATSKRDGHAQASLVVTVSDLALTWSAETYTPKWYGGRALPTRSATVAVAAVPQIYLGGALIPPERLIFTWGVDDQDAVRSGVGMDILRVEMSRLYNSSHQVRVRVQDIDRRVRKEGVVLLRPTEPSLLLYPYYPLGGIEPRRSVNASAFPRGLLDFQAEPFFFPIAAKNELTYRWALERRDAAGSPELPYLISIDTTNFQGNATLLELAAEQINGLKFFVSKLFDIKFR